MALGDCAACSAAPGAHRETSRQLLILVPSLQDIKRCLNALEELGTLQVTSHILQKHTDVVATLKKVGQRPQSLPGGSEEPAWATSALRAFLLSLFGADPSL